MGISTAGDIANGFLAQRVTTLKKVLSGTIKDKAYDSYFIFYVLLNKMKKVISLIQLQEKLPQLMIQMF